MADKKLVILDGSSLIYRAFFALPSLTTADGTPTNAVYGYTAMLLKILEEERPDVILLTMEGGRTFRHDAFADYKAHRPRTPDDLAVQVPLARTLTEAMRVPIIQQRGYEADDVIGTLTCRGREAGFEVLVVTGDLDALQLVNEHVRVMINRRGTTDTQVYDEAAVLERFGLPPSLLPDFKALKGDTSDNIPGIAGIGDKTATALLVQYGSLEGLLEHAEEVKAARVRQNLLEGRENARLYKRLATIVTELPLETPFEEWTYPGPNLPESRPLFQALEFRTLARRLEQIYGPAGTAAPVPVPPAPGEHAELAWQQVEDVAELDGWIARTRSAGCLAVRTLQSGSAGRTGVLQGIALSTDEGTVVLGDATPAGEGLLAAAADPWAIPAPLLELLSAPNVTLVGYDLKREVHALRSQGVAAASPAFDAALAAYVLNPGRSTYRLEDLAREYLGQEAPPADTLAGVARETGAAWQLREPLAARLKNDELEKVYYELELPLVPVLARMEELGVRVNRQELRTLSERLAQQIAHLEEQATGVLGRAFNLGSPKQLQEILFTELGLPAGRRTKTGYSTDSDVLQDLAAVHALPALILEWREVAKLKSTYADALQNLVDPADARVHTKLNQMVAATGRLSSSDPNLQNIPVRTEVGREIRSAFIPAEGMRLLSADYSQIELRIMAHISRDPELVRAFEEGRDVHAATASRVFGVPLEGVTGDMRRSAKTVNFAVLYGQREFGLSRQLRIPLKDAAELVAAYFQQFPGVRRYTEQTLRQARELGYVNTLPPFERKRYIPGIHAGNRNERMAAEREAGNAPIQGTASDIIKLAMIRLDRAMRERSLRSRMILQVHDELLFEVVPEEEAEMAALVRSEMEGSGSLDVPLRVEVKFGCNWRDVEPGGD